MFEKQGEKISKIETELAERDLKIEKLVSKAADLRQTVVEVRGFKGLKGFKGLGVYGFRGLGV